MSILTVRIKTRPRPAKTITRRRLHGKDRVYAQNARKHLALALGHDARIDAVGGTIDAARLVFSGDTALQTKAQAVVDALDDVLSQSLKITRS